MEAAANYTNEGGRRPRGRQRPLLPSLFSAMTRRGEGVRSIHLACFTREGYPGESCKRSGSEEVLTFGQFAVSIRFLPSSTGQWTGRRETILSVDSLLYMTENNRHAVRDW